LAWTYSSASGWIIGGRGRREVLHRWILAGILAFKLMPITKDMLVVAETYNVVTVFLIGMK
jgi:hypothetical protein